MEKLLENRLCLGTAQFGMHYGINNKRGQISKREAFEILDEALKIGVNTVDTAQKYGESEKLLGEFLKQNKSRLKIISKLSRCEKVEIADILESSLRRLGIPTIYGYLVHDFENYQKNPEIWYRLLTLKNKGKIEKIGFSIYMPRQLEILLDTKINLDIIQVPYSIFDRRLESYFVELKKRGTEIYVRSIFLQGLFFVDKERIKKDFILAEMAIDRLCEISEKNNIPLYSLCLCFVLINPYVDKIVIGVDSLQQFKENVSSVTYIEKVKNMYDKLSSLSVYDEKIIIPYNWKGS